MRLIIILLLILAGCKNPVETNQEAEIVFIYTGPDSGIGGQFWFDGYDSTMGIPYSVVFESDSPVNRNYNFLTIWGYSKNDVVVLLQDAAIPRYTTRIEFPVDLRTSCGNFKVRTFNFPGDSARVRIKLWQ